MEVALGGGQEWTSEPLHFGAGDYICLRCDSAVRFYAGLFEENEYAAARSRSPTVFPFVRGTDQTVFEKPVEVRFPSAYRVVLRIGIFAPVGLIKATLWRAAKIVAPTRAPMASLPEDPSAELARSRRGRLYFSGILTAVVAIGVWLLWYDFSVIGPSNRTDFFNALSAEATAVLAIGVVLGGLYAMWRELGFPQRK